MTAHARDLQTQPRQDTDSADESELQAGLVSEEALRMLELRAQPFAAEIEDGQWFADDTTREQLVDIKEALINGDDLLLISGVSGSGKSVLLKQLSADSGTRIQCFSVRGSARFSTFNLFSGLLEAFKLKPPAELKDTLKDVLPCLQALAERNMLGVIVLDDADRISDEELSMLLGSVQYLNSGEDTLLRLLMATGPEFEARIPELLPTSSDLPYAALTIEPFDIGRAAAYLNYRLNKVGEFEEFLFSEKQMGSICEAAQGLPGALNIAAAAQINQLCQPTPVVSADVPQEYVEAAPLLQSQPVKYALGALGSALILASAYLFVRPPADTGSDQYQVVSRSAVTPVDVNARESAPDTASGPELISLVNEPDTTLPGAENPAAAVTPPADNASGTAASSAGGTTVAAQQPASSTSDSNPAIPPPAPVPDSGSTVAQNPAQNAAASNSAPAVEQATQTAAASGEQTAAQSDQTASAAPQATADASTPSATPPTSQPAAAAATAGDSGSKSPVAVLESANWVLVQDPELYTVQMSASRERNSVEEFLIRSKLDGPNSIFSFKRGERTWYALVHGLYPTITEARNAIESMPAAAKTNQPWIRAIAQIQNTVRNQ